MNEPPMTHSNGVHPSDLGFKHNGIHPFDLGIKHNGMHNNPTDLGMKQNGMHNTPSELAMKWNPRNLEIKTRSVERNLEPLVMQVGKDNEKFLFPHILP